MKTFKGTPGPWSVDPASTNSLEVITEHEVKVCDIIADNENDLLTELEWNNARLIAAAPEMVEALQFIITVANSRGHDQNKLKTIIEFAEIALKKALGGSYNG